METNKDFSNKKRLGRGLGSLLGGSPADSLSVVDDAANFQAVPASQALNQQPQAKSAPSAQMQAPRPVVPTSANSANKAQTANTAALNQNAEVKKVAPPQVDQAANESRVWNIAIDKLVPGVYQPRKNFNKESLAELTSSIKENGIIQPISVRKRKEGGFEIIAGERRWRAAQAAGLHEIPAIIKNISDREALQIALIENIQREDLDPIEEAESYARLIEEFSLSQAEAAEKVGKERSSVANALRLLGLPFEVREMLTNKMISVGHAKAILSLADKTKQIAMAKRAAETQMSVRTLENEIKSSQRSAGKDQTKGGALGQDLAGKLAQELADQLQKSLGTKVQINYRAGKGSVEVHFYSDDQLTQIYEKLKG